ncbi:YjbF family lipoprotein [Vibrio cidicii]|uniref:YjbF family lipoprotein n=1 Tax=Vibrio cidicii TaxID=1763883 RepID=UPI0018C32A08|nr:YjbF family lipoprotein [Vibrio cidicii]
MKLFETPQRMPMVFFVLNILLLNGCVQKFSHVNDTLKEGLFGIEDITISAEEVSRLPYASSYMRFNQGPRVFMVLALAEPNPSNGQQQLKWLSSDGAMVVTEGGRVVKTLNLAKSNLARRQPLDLDVEISTFPSWSQHSTWLERYDWSLNNHYGHIGKAQLTFIGKSKVISTLWQDELNHWQEEIVFEKLNRTLRNQYWVDSQGYIMKSIQYLGPDMSRVEVEILKPFKE